MEIQEIIVGILVVLFLLFIGEYSIDCIEEVHQHTKDKELIEKKDEDDGI